MAASHQQPDPEDTATDRHHVVALVGLLDRWRTLLLRQEGIRLHVLARFKAADSAKAEAQAILDGLEAHGRPAARFVAGQGGDSVGVLACVQALLQDDGRADQLVRSHFDAIRLVLDAALIHPEACGNVGKGQADNKPDKKRKNRAACPQSANVLKFIKKANDSRNRGRSLIDIALEIAEGNKSKAQGIARQARRYRHLIDR